MNHPSQKKGSSAPMAQQAPSRLRLAVDSNRPLPPLWLALIPIVFLVAALGLTVIWYHAPPHIALVAATAVAVLAASSIGVSWKTSLAGITSAIAMTLPACLILMLVGMLIGVWILAGIVPTLVIYGLDLLSPRWFLPAACIVSSVVSLATGSSWSTAGTVGVALMGIGSGLGVPPAMTAGAVISGSYFGDKMSPLSDTTNLAAAVAGTDLFVHIKHMLYTTVPSLTAALVIYTILGWSFTSSSAAVGSLHIMTTTVQQTFLIQPILLFVPAAVIAMVIARIPALPALFLGTLLGAVFAWAYQGAGLSQILDALQFGYHGHTGHASVDKLLNRGGLSSMMSTIALIMFALSFGGAMERSGLLARLTTAVLHLVRGRGSLVAATVSSCIGVNIVAGDQYMSIVIPGRMYRPAFKAYHLAPKNLSRCLEDAGTLTSSLIPWNSGGAFMHATLGISPLAYLPYAYLNLINPLLSLTYGFTGLTMTSSDDQEQPPSSDQMSYNSLPPTVSGGETSDRDQNEGHPMDKTFDGPLP